MTVESRPLCRWHVRPADADAATVLATEMGITPWTAQILLHRGITSADKARALCAGTLRDLLPPSRLKDVDTAAERIVQAIRQGERILVYGDYDVDGLTATAMLVRFLALAGAKADAHIPDRLSEGYGLNADVIEELVSRPEPVSLVITVDTGTTAVQEARMLREAGVDLIITDHHEPGPDLPHAVALVNPKQPACDYPEKVLPGVGVAYKLVWAVAVALSGSWRVKPKYRTFLAGEALALAAVGIVADAVPLQGENHILTRFGLRLLKGRRHMGLSRLGDVARVPAEHYSAQHIAFRLAPRLNAAGRTGNAQRALDLLLSDCPELTGAIAAELDQANRERQSIEQRILASAVEQAEALAGAGALPPALVLGADDWHVGVIGIVASRLVERYYRPTVLVAFDPETGIGRGSARSVPGFSLHEALAACDACLLTHGGHAAAAGMSCRREDFETFVQHFCDYAATRLDAAQRGPTLEIDLDIPLAEVNHTLVRELATLEPYGQGNPTPVFVSRNLRLAGTIRLMGRKQAHASFMVRQDRCSLRCVGFGFGERVLELEAMARAPIDIVYTPQRSTFNGRVELVLKDIRPSAAGAADC